MSARQRRPPRLNPVSVLRVLLGLLAGPLLVGSRVAKRVPSVLEDPLPLLALLAGVLALGLAVVPRIRPVHRALGALLVATPGYWLLFRLHAYVTFPQVDWLRTHGIDRGAWLPMAAMLVAVVVARLVRGRRARGRLGGAGALLLALCMAGAYWFVPQHFNMERVEPQGGLLYLSPVVRDGELEHAFWTRRVIRGRPLSLLGTLVESERTVADLAHGMHLERSEQLRALAGDPSDAQLRDRVRAALWAVQKPATALMLIVQLGAMPLFLLVALGLLFGWRPGRWAGRILLSCWLLPTLGVALINLVFHLVMALCLLPDPVGERSASLALSVSLLLLVLALERAGAVLARPVEVTKP